MVLYKGHVMAFNVVERSRLWRQDDRGLNVSSATYEVI